MKDVNEDFSKLFVETLVNNTVKYYADYKTKRAQRNYDLIKHQVDSIKRSLLGNIETIAETNDLNVNPIKQKVRASSQKTQVDASANAALYQELLKQMGLAQITLNRETPLIQIIDKPVLPLLNEKPSRLITGIVFAIIGGFLISIFIILSNSFAERSRKSFHS
jgi:capsule polysaccharide export protein KpsE/RkpR